MDKLPIDIIRYISYYFYGYEYNKLRIICTKFKKAIPKIPFLPFEIYIHISKFMNQKNRIYFYLMNSIFFKWYKKNCQLIFMDYPRSYFGNVYGPVGPTGPEEPTGFKYKVDIKFYKQKYPYNFINNKKQNFQHKKIKK